MPTTTNPFLDMMQRGNARGRFGNLPFGNMFGGGRGNPFGNTGGGISGGLDPIHRGMADTLGEAGRLADIEDKRYQESLGFARGEFDRFNSTPAISDDEINQKFGQAAEGVGADANQAYSNLRQGLGDSGFFAGAGAGLASQIELSRLGQLTGAARDLRLYKARLDSDKAMQRLQASQGLADRMNQSPSALRLDALGQNTGLEVTLEGIRAQERAANKAASASKSAGKSSGIGSLIGGAIGLI